MVTIPDITIPATLTWKNFNTLSSIPVGEYTFQLLNKGPDVVYIAESEVEPSVTTSLGLPLFPVFSDKSKDSFCILQVNKGSKDIWIRSSNKTSNIVISVINIRDNEDN